MTEIVFPEEYGLLNSFVVAKGLSELLGNTQ